ncbi:MAG: class I SAM-dependent methyltransferase [Firmicutes bacterium]|nr:class I SAM-dependent methyltransferase [Bacillota bacterium]
MKLIPPDSVVCDIGCGPHGKLLFDAEDKIRAGYGFDNLVEDRNTEKITLKRFNLEKDRIPLEDETADAAVSLAVLEHLDNPLHVLKEIYRILKPGGILLLTTPTPAAKPVLEFLAYKAGLVSRREIDEHKHYFNKKELMEIMAEAGFSKEKVKADTFQFGFNNRVVGYK